MSGGIEPSRENAISKDTKIEVLLAEWESLRTEAMQRDTSLNQVLLYGGGAIVAIAGYLATTTTFFLGLVLLLLGICLVFFAFKMVEYDVRHLSARLRDVEAQVNGLAGEDLLKWETTRGLLTEGYASRFAYVRDAFAVLLKEILRGLFGGSPTRGR